MIDEISFQIANESGECIKIDTSHPKIQSQLDIVTADTFTQICFAINEIKDDESRSVEKFHFALHLKSFLKELKEYVY